MLEQRKTAKSYKDDWHPASDLNWTPINVRSGGGVYFQVDANFVLICNILKPSWCEVIPEICT
jgi:hypothetical protein